MKAVMAGSFDPVTTGHVALIENASRLCEKLYVFMADNAAKHYMFSLETRLDWLKHSLGHLENVEVVLCEGTVVTLAKELGAGVLFRGLRSSEDFSYEQQIAWINARIAPDIQTVYLGCDPALSLVSSSAVRELYRNHQSLDGLVPDCVLNSLQSGKEQA